MSVVITVSSQEKSLKNEHILANAQKYVLPLCNPLACSLQLWINPEGPPFGVSDEIPVFEVVLVIDFLLRTNFSNGRFQVPSIRGGAVPMERKEVA